MDKMKETCSEEERMRRNIAKNERKRLYKSVCGEKKNRLRSTGCDISIPMWAGRKASNELYVTILCQANIYLSYIAMKI